MRLVLFLLTILLMADVCRSKTISEFLKSRKRRAVSVTFMDMYVQSEGCNDPVVPSGTCGTATIKVHGVDHSLHQRGHNIVTVNAQTGVFIDSKAFDTHGDGNAGVKMRDYLNTITGDKIVLCATQDSASNTWLPAKDALKRLGVTEPILVEFRSSFAFIGYAGTNKPSWIAQEQRKIAEGPSIIHLRIALQQSSPEPRMSVYVRSEGCEDPGKTGPCGLGFIKVNNQGYSLHSRGINVAVFCSGGVFLETRGFDTHALSNAALSAVNYLNRLSGEKIVLFSVQDEASRFGGPVLAALNRLGARDPNLNYRSSLALVGYAGSYMPSWIGQAQALRGLGPSIVTALIEPEADDKCLDS